MKQMTKKGQAEIITVVFTVVFFFLAFFVLGKAELDNHLISNFIDSAVSTVAPMNNPEVSFTVKAIVPAMFIFMFIFFLFYIRGVVSAF